MQKHDRVVGCVYRDVYRCSIGQQVAVGASYLTMLHTNCPGADNRAIGESKEMNGRLDGEISEHLGD